MPCLYRCSRPARWNDGQNDVVGGIPNNFRVFGTGRCLRFLLTEIIRLYDKSFQVRFFFVSYVLVCLQHIHKSGPFFFSCYCLEVSKQQKSLA